MCEQEIRRYVAVDQSGREVCETVSDDLDTVRAAAQANGHAVTCLVYEMADNTLVWTPDGSDTWPSPS